MVRENIFFHLKNVFVGFGGKEKEMGKEFYMKLMGSKWCKAYGKMIVVTSSSQLQKWMKNIEEIKKLIIKIWKILFKNKVF